MAPPLFKKKKKKKKKILRVCLRVGVSNSFISLHYLKVLNNYILFKYI